MESISEGEADEIGVQKMEQYKAVKIYEPGDGLDEDALKSVLEQPSVKSKPLMLLSVAGHFRMGKSFLLTLLLRYLRNKGHINGEWLGNEDINDGFSWKGGSAPDTQGILIWSEPFFVKDQQNQEVAVFLMDTQGMFDHNGDKELCTKIFAFSTLLSSVQVFNLCRQIQENDLEYLQLFVEYASAARKFASVESKLSQNLMFLIRDWQYCADHDFGLDEPQGGYLDGCFKFGASSRYLSGIRKNFQSLQCFLMPGPGNRVAVARRNYMFSGQIDDIDEEFLEYVGKLARCLFSPENIVVKRIKTQTATSTDLLNFAILCNEFFGHLPKPKSPVEINAEVYSLKALEQCRRKYEELIEENFKDFVVEGNITKMHDEIEVEVKALLKEKLIFRGDKLIGKYTRLFTEWMQNKEEVVRKRNDILKETKSYDMEEKSSRLILEYGEKVYICPEDKRDMWKKFEDEFDKEFSTYPKYFEQKNIMVARKMQMDKMLKRFSVWPPLEKERGALAKKISRGKQSSGSLAEEVMAGASNACKAVRIVNSKGELDEDALKSVLEQPSVRNKPLMLLSVAGDFRKGKSFLLTLFLRYLRNKGYTNSEWLGKEDLNDGFSWRGGTESTTQGILIWDEPFFVKDAKKRDVAIFFMDTQGLFDHVADKELTTKIFVFSTLLSSVQVFNLSQQIQDNHLEYLQYLVESAAMAQTTTSYGSKPFQRLLFLIRDWQHNDYEFGLDQPEGYLDSVLNCEGGNVSSVRKGIRENFQTLDCFLLPYPGRKVAVTGNDYNFCGQIDDIDEEFLVYVGQLAKCLLSPENIVVKRIEHEGRMLTVTSTQLLKFAISCSRKLVNGALPKTKSISEINAEAHSEAAREECMEEYRNLEIERFKYFVPIENVRKLHEEIVAEVRISLKKKMIFGGDEFISKYMEQFTEWAKKKGEMVIKSNNSLLAKKIHEMKAKRAQLLQEYGEKVSENFEIRREIWRDIEERFGEEFSSYPEYFKQKDEMESSRSKVDKMFQTSSGRGMTTQEVWMKHIEVVEIMKLVISANNGDEYAGGQLSGHLWDLAAELFKEDMNLIGADIQDFTTMEFPRIIGDLLRKYRRVMSEGLRDRYVMPEVMHEMHEIVTEIVIGEFRSEILRKCNVTSAAEKILNFETNLQNALDDDFKDFLDLNSKNAKFSTITTRTLTSFVDSLGDAEDFLGPGWFSYIIIRKEIPIDWERK